MFLYCWAMCFMWFLLMNYYWSPCYLTNETNIFDDSKNKRSLYALLFGLKEVSQTLTRSCFWIKLRVSYVCRSLLFSHYVPKENFCSHWILSLLRCLWVVRIEMNEVSQKFQDYNAKQIVLKKKVKIHCQFLKFTYWELLVHNISNELF